MTNIKDLLEEKFISFNQPRFIPHDPISIPHQFTQPQDIEIMGFWAAILAWGQRKTIINKCQELILLMDGAPYDFVKNHQASDLKPFLSFKHRTFNAADTLYFLDFFKRHYAHFDTLESAFLIGYSSEDEDITQSLVAFRHYFFSGEFIENRTKKHVATPEKNATCKRLCMFLRWMVRSDNRGVDFGIWKNIAPRHLVCPCDVHVDRVARKLGLISRPQTDWKTAIELTQHLRTFDPIDPAKYDFALFGLGVEGYL
jgi:uncharacterized protein (TIGR02757 family)